ncbi:EF-hand domain-containing protein [Tropicimonas sp. IMCC34043]|uniref:EF-hand domain-containing protein n=1 Tax=Tropicimonas sp. IMCC34043 TaxID=2248760 RepID=UPI000E269A26|nr:EF-hand domain-containing protein [Tropicimonas sp. IMCC34043]
MTRILVLGSAIALGLAVTGGADAFGGSLAQSSRPSFAELDSNGDGRVTAAELGVLPATRMNDLFATADRNRDGRITREELSRMTATRGTLGPQRADRMMMRLDLDRDGTITWAEARTAAGQNRSTPPGAQLMARADTNRDGVITAAEYAAATALMQQRLGGQGQGQRQSGRGQQGQGGQGQGGRGGWQN